MSRELRNRLYEWHVRVAEAIVAMSPDAIERMNAWRAEHPEKSDADWPEVIAIVGPRPKPAQILRIVNRERIA